jgi:hypothetical protein
MKADGKLKVGRRSGSDVVCTTNGRGPPPNTAENNAPIHPRDRGHCSDGCTDRVDVTVAWRGSAVFWFRGMMGSRVSLVV